MRLGGPDEIVFKLGVDDTTAAQQLISDSGEAKDAFGSGFVPPAQLKQITSNATPSRGSRCRTRARWSTSP